MLTTEVDVDEADVAVLSQNLTRSKELFAAINQSLRTISARTSTASQGIKPVFAEINSLNRRKASIEEGLALLQDVSHYSSRAAEAQQTLNSPIATVGAARYLICLEQSRTLLRDMKKNIRDFDGVVISFANAVDMAEINVVSYLSNILSQFNIESGNVPAQDEAVAILEFFAKQKNLRNAYETIEKSFSRILVESLAPFEASCVLEKRPPNIPFERGSNELSSLTSEMLTCVQGMQLACGQLGVQGSSVLRNIVASYMETRLHSILASYNKFLETNGMVGQELVVLDILDHLKKLDTNLQPYQFGFDSVPKFLSEYKSLVTRAQLMLKDWAKYVDNRVSQVERFNEISIPEVVVEVLSKIRRVAEFDSIFTVMKEVKLGSWLDVKPPLRFVTVYTSIVQGAEAQAEDHTVFLVSSFLSDLIDELIIGIEINLKEQTGDAALRKSTQGYLLVKNLVLVETIVNRSESLYSKLGSIGMERLSRLKNRFLKLFLDDWNYASYIIIRDMTQITTTNALHGGQNSTKEKDQIKDLFKNFNESFEEALKHYEKFNIQEKDLRAYLGGEIKKLIINAYNKLYDKYGSGEFTKNRSKYIKYDKMQFERLLNDKL